MEHLNSPYCMDMGMEAVIRWHRIGCKIINYWQKYLFLKSHPKIEQRPKNNVYAFLRNLLPRYFTSFINLTTLVSWLRFHENNANSENQWLVVTEYLLWIVELARFQKVSFLSLFFAHQLFDYINLIEILFLFFFLVKWNFIFYL
jgi:hypothetical protein